MVVLSIDGDEARVVLQESVFLQFVSREVLDDDIYLEGAPENKRNIFKQSVALT